MDIHGVHLYNDFSGSPLVFSQLLKHWAGSGHNVFLYTSGQKGRLSDIGGVHYRQHEYRWTGNKLLTFYRFFKVNFQLYRKIRKAASKDDVVYINTLLPFGAALAGKRAGAKVIYHVHETSVRPAWFKKLLKMVQSCTADNSVYVSKYLKKQEGGKIKPATVVYNALPDSFFSEAKGFSVGEKPEDHRNILMLASLRAYKGIEEFFQLARRMPEYTFELVLNAGENEIEEFLRTHSKPENLILHAAVRDVHPFYRRAGWLLNLSRPDQWVETFGMTIIEAMAYGIPVIAPPVGGPAEIVTEETGFCISSYRLEEIEQTIRAVHANPGWYKRLSVSALQRAEQFRSGKFLKSVDDLLFNSARK